MGLVLVIAGAGITRAFHTLPWSRGCDIWDVGFLLIMEAYSIVGSLLILLGLRYGLGGSRFVEPTIARSLRHFGVAVVLFSFSIVVTVVFAFR